MRITHRVPAVALTNNMTGRLDPDYEREVERQTAQRVTRFEAAERALEAATKRAQKAERKAAEASTTKAKRLTARELTAAWELVEHRRNELDNLHRLMTATPAGSANRGTKSFRQVPARQGSIIPTTKQ